MSAKLNSTLARSAVALTATAAGAAVALIVAFEIPGRQVDSRATTAGIATPEVAAAAPQVPDTAAPDLGTDGTSPSLDARERTSSGSGVGTAAPAPRKPIPASVITHGPRNSNGVAITLDADLSYWTLQQVQGGAYPAQVNTAVLDYLEASNTPATVFVTGLWAQQYPDAMRRMAASGLFELANHTWSHEAWTSNCYRLPTIEDPATLTSQAQRTSEVIASYTGSYPAFFRFPGLCHDPADVARVADLGMTTVDTDVAAGDAFVSDPERAAFDIASRTQPGSIIVLHLNGAPNAAHTTAILTRLVPQLRDRGLEPVTMTDLLLQ